MTFKEYAQKIMEGCGNFEGYKCVEKYVRDKGLCPECQRAKQTAIDLGKRETEFLEDKIEAFEGLLFFVDKDEEIFASATDLLNTFKEEIKDIQSGLKVLEQGGKA